LSLIVQRPQAGPDEIGLFEMVTTDLLVLHHPFGGCRLEPVDELLM
jgi:hypothetical protein